MQTNDPDIILKSLNARSGRLCFYPSCGYRSSWVIAGLDADVFVFADKSPKNAYERERFSRNFIHGFKLNGMHPILEFENPDYCLFRLNDKLLFLFFQDNNQVLSHIHEAGWEISIFVGICDGCFEGGNYECVHDDPFLSKILDTATDGMEYITDHSNFLNGGNQKFGHYALHSSGWEFSLHSLLFKDLEDDEDRYKILEFPDRMRISTEASNISLARLKTMRESYPTSMLAQYEVKKTTKTVSLTQLQSIGGERIMEKQIVEISPIKPCIEKPSETFLSGMSGNA